MAHARIGRIRMKDTNVVPLRQGAEVRDECKLTFANHTAASVESYVAKYGERPDSVVIVLGGLKQTAESYWLNGGSSRGGSTSMLALAASTLNREIAS